MKKLFLLVAIVALSFTNATAQGGFNIGVNGAIPVGDAGDGYGFGIIGDFSYLWEVADGVEVGPAVSVLHYFGSTETVTSGALSIEVDYEDATYIPIGGTGRVMFGEFYLGADLGYGIGVAPDGNDGGFYYRPRVGYSFGTVGVTASYSGVANDGFTFSSVNFGVEFGL